MIMFYVKRASHIRSSVRARDAVLVDYSTPPRKLYRASNLVFRCLLAPISEVYPKG